MAKTHEISCLTAFWQCPEATVPPVWKATVCKPLCLKQRKRNLAHFFRSHLSSGSLKTRHDLGEPWHRAFTLSGQGSQTTRGDGWEIKPRTFFHYSHEECRPLQWRLESVRFQEPIWADWQLLLAPELEWGRLGEGGGCARSYASTVKEADRLKVLHLPSTSVVVSFKPHHLELVERVHPWITKQHRELLSN